MTEQLIELIQGTNAGRAIELRALKYEAMAENFFRFFRGTAQLFYLAIFQVPELADSPMAWLCGDLHLENFGTYRSDNRLVYFDLNDYDDGALGPVVWEVTRMLASIFVGFASLDIEEKKARKLAAVFLNIYTRTLAGAKPRTIETRDADGIVGDFLRKVAKRRQRHILRKRTRKRRGKKLEILMSHQKHLPLEGERKLKIMQHVQEWITTDDRSPYNYQVIDATFRIAGTSSLGLQRFVILLKSSNKAGEKYLLIDMKEAAPSALADYLTVAQPAWENEAERIISVQNRMQDRCPALLSTSIFEGRAFVMQEMQPEEDSISFHLLADRYRDMYTVINNMAMLTASAQLRSSGQKGSATTDVLQNWVLQDQQWQERALDFAYQYSLTVKEDYAHYCSQYAAGMLG